MAGDVQDVTLGEIVRSLTDLREELRALRGEHVRRDLYEAHRATVAAELDRIERKVDADSDGRSTTRRMAAIAVLSAVLTLGVNLVLVLAR